MLHSGDCVFYCDSTAEHLEYGTAAHWIIRSLDLVPIIWGGAGMGIELSSPDREARDDLYRSKVVVVRLGPPALLDNWALLERETGLKHGIDFLVYSTDTVPDVGLSQVAVLVSAPEVFSARLRQDLIELIG